MAPSIPITVEGTNIRASKARIFEFLFYKKIMVKTVKKLIFPPKNKHYFLPEEDEICRDLGTKTLRTLEDL